MELGEVVVWRGSTGHFGKPLLAVLLVFVIFIGFPIMLGLAGGAFFMVFLLVPIVFALVTLRVTLFYSLNRYLITSRRILVGRTSLRLDELADVRVEKDFLDRGQVFFTSRAGAWLVFKRVKDPEHVKETVLNAKASLPSVPPPMVLCGYCQARVPVGTMKCPGCGANL